MLKDAAPAAVAAQKGALSSRSASAGFRVPPAPPLACGCLSFRLSFSEKTLPLPSFRSRPYAEPMLLARISHEP